MLLDRIVPLGLEPFDELTHAPAVAAAGDLEGALDRSEPPRCLGLGLDALHLS